MWVLGEMLVESYREKLEQEWKNIRKKIEQEWKNMEGEFAVSMCDDLELESAVAWIDVDMCVEDFLRKYGFNHIYTAHGIIHVYAKSKSGIGAITMVYEGSVFTRDGADSFTVIFIDDFFKEISEGKIPTMKVKSRYDTESHIEQCLPWKEIYKYGLIPRIEDVRPVKNSLLEICRKKRTLYAEAWQDTITRQGRAVGKIQCLYVPLENYNPELSTHREFLKMLGEIAKIKEIKRICDESESAKRPIIKDEDIEKEAIFRRDDRIILSALVEAGILPPIRVYSWLKELKYF